MIEKDGKSYVRVSEVLEGYADYSHIKASVLKRKQEIGTCVHRAIEDYIKDDLPLLSEETCHYFESFQRWHQELKPKFIQLETRYFDEEFMLTGCVDGLAFLPGSDCACLIDYKTSAAESPAWIMQAHLYYHLVTTVGKIPVLPTFFFLQLKSNGTLPKVYMYKYNPALLQKGLDLTRAFWLNEKKVRKNLDENKNPWL